MNNLVGVVWIIIFLIVVPTLFGCERPLEHPESVDPIYSDLRSRADSVAKEIIDLQKSADELSADYEKLGARDYSKTRKKNSLSKYLRKIREKTQEQAYLEARVKSRLAYDQSHYPTYYENKMDWPDKDEFFRYQTNKRLNSVSRSWSDRVPKSKYSVAPATKAVEKKEGASEGRAAQPVATEDEIETTPEVEKEKSAATSAKEAKAKE